MFEEADKPTAPMDCYCNKPPLLCAFLFSNPNLTEIIEENLINPLLNEIPHEKTSNHLD